MGTGNISTVLAPGEVVTFGDIEASVVDGVETEVEIDGSVLFTGGLVLSEGAVELHPITTRPRQNEQKKAITTFFENSPLFEHSIRISDSHSRAARLVTTARHVPSYKRFRKIPLM
ncbi:MAG: hypothetical protein ACRDTC_22415 [Pseudonocardiaceae bacterium]